MLKIWTQSKPKLAYTLKPQNKWTNNKTKKSEEPKLEPLPQHKNSLELDLTIPLNQSNQQQNQ